MTDYKASKRIVGTSAERTALSPTKALSNTGVSTSNLKAYYNFNESSGNITNQQTTGDGLGSAADITISGATYSQTGKVGNALSFDGSDDYGELGSSTSQWNFIHGTGDWTINFWVNHTSFTSEDRYFSNMDSTETKGINMYQSTTSLGLALKSGSGWMHNGNLAYNQTLSTGTWYMITVTCDYSLSSANYTVYVNGTAQGTGNRATTGSTDDTEYSLKAMCRGNAADKFAHGLLDEVSLWDRLLTTSEISTIYKADPNLQANSIFEETDTGKHYIWSGSAWTEIV